jgi:hypothetical protein
MRKLTNICISIGLIALPQLASAAPECDKSGEYGRKIYLQKRLGMTLARYRQIEGPAPHPVVDLMERELFAKKLLNEDHAALMANTICNNYFDRLRKR